MFNSILPKLVDRQVTLNGRITGKLKFVRSAEKDTVYAVNSHKFDSFYVNMLLIIGDQIFISTSRLLEE